MRKCRPILFAMTLALMGASPNATAKPPSTASEQVYQHKETRDLVTLVNDAADLVHTQGEKAFDAFRKDGSRWRKKETYVFVIDLDGKMLVHPDPEMEGKDELDLKDIQGKPIIRGLIEVATALPDKPEGWYHYQWPVPGEILPRWKSSYVRLVAAPSGRKYIVGSGVYNDRMERTFVVDMVKDAVGLIEKEGDGAYSRFRDPTSRFIAKDAYIFVIDPDGVDLVNPAFPNLEGRNILDVKDTRGKHPIREMLKLVQAQGSGWMDYMWPKPGESVSTRKSAFVSKAKMGDKWVMVGCGVYLADAPKAPRTGKEMTAPKLMQFVREGAAVLEKRGEAAFQEFRKKDSKWFHGDLYFFVWDLDGKRIFHAADPKLEGQDGSDAKDIHERPYGKMFLHIAETPSGEGWVHYMYPKPDEIFPAWKSTFLKRVTFPSGKQYLLGSGIYNMQMDKALIEDLVDRASILVAKKGNASFNELRDQKGRFFFMDTYVFVDKPDGTELVNPAFPSLEGTNIMELKDAKGIPVAKEYINAAMKVGSAWMDYLWYKPGSNKPSRKRTYVKKVQSGEDVYIVGSGYYVD